MVLSNAVIITAPNDFRLCFVAPATFQEVILQLQNYWAEHGCVVLQPLDMEVGAGTFHPATFLRSLGPENWNAAYVQPSVAPLTVDMAKTPIACSTTTTPAAKPSQPSLGSLSRQSVLTGHRPAGSRCPFCRGQLGITHSGAWGLGWEVWLNGMEVSQFTYFQQAGGLECHPVTGELTYGLERIAMYLQGVESVYDLIWANTLSGPVTYGDVYHQNEVEMSTFNRRLSPPVLPIRFRAPAMRWQRDNWRCPPTSMS